MTGVFDQLIPLLIDAIPRSIAALRLSESICCLRVYYYDTHAPSAYLLLKPVTESFRNQLLASQGRSALFYLWGSGEPKGDGPQTILGDSDADRATAELFNRIYELLCDDENRHMPAYRQALHRVAQQLNARDWSQICPVTDDFVVVPADGSMHFVDELADIAGSIPSASLELLRSRGLLGPEGHWDRRPGFSYGEEEQAESARRVQEIEERVRAMPQPDQINYWIGQLDCLAGGTPCDMTRIGVNAHFPLDRLDEFGKDATVALLELAGKWADQPEWDSDDENAAQETPMARVMLYLLWKVKEMQHASPEMERLLQDFLRRSCQINEGRSLWGTLPFHSADCLHELFDRYPEPQMAGNNALENRAEFLSILLP